MFFSFSFTVSISSLRNVRGIQIGPSSRHNGMEMEVDVLTTRIEYFRNKIDGIDYEMKDFINNKAASLISWTKIKEN